MKFVNSTFGWFCLAVLLLGLCGCAGSRPQIEGVWEKIVPASPGKDSPVVKILADGHFAFGRQSSDGSTTWSGGGNYSYDGEKYTETVTYHWVPAIVGMTIEFDCLVEGGKWFHEAQFVAGGEKFHIDEVWQRIEEPAVDSD